MNSKRGLYQIINFLTEYLVQPPFINLCKLLVVRAIGQLMYYLFFKLFISDLIKINVICCQK